MCDILDHDTPTDIDCITAWDSCSLPPTDLLQISQIWCQVRHTFTIVRQHGQDYSTYGSLC